MRQDVEQILLAADDAESFEAPAGFDWRRATEQVRSLQSRLRAILGPELEYDDTVQDASFFCEYRIVRPGPKVENYTGLPGPMTVVVSVLFSAFGRLVTIHHNDTDGGVSLLQIGEVIDALESVGFVYVSADSLDERYTGPFRGAIGMSPFVPETWMARFFDWA